MIIAILRTGSIIELPTAVGRKWDGNILICLDVHGQRVTAFAPTDLRAIAVARKDEAAVWEIFHPPALRPRELALPGVNEPEKLLKGLPVLNKPSAGNVIPRFSSHKRPDKPSPAS